MKRVATLLILLPFGVLLIVYVTATSPFCAEIHGWIKSETCWVVKEPSKDAKIIGIIIKKAAVTVEDAGGGWLKIVFAPVRSLPSGKLVVCKGCCIQKNTMTTVAPWKW